MWDTPSFVCIAGSVYLASDDKAIFEGQKRYASDIAEDSRVEFYRNGYYRPFWRVGSVEEFVCRYNATVAAAAAAETSDY